MPNCDSINLGMKVMKAVTMAHSAVYDRLTNRKVMLLRILSAALGRSGTQEKTRLPCYCRALNYNSFILFYLALAHYLNSNETSEEENYKKF